MKRQVSLSHIEALTLCVAVVASRPLACEEEEATRSMKNATLRPPAIICSRNKSHTSGCPLALEHVLESKLADVRHCWQRKFAGSPDPDKWRPLDRPLRNAYARQTANQSTISITDAFENVYQNKEWAKGGGGKKKGKGGPLSGSGSTLEATFDVRAALLLVILKHRVKRIVDAPCGDLTWISSLFPAFEALGVAYTGVDAVRTQIAKHHAAYALPGVREFAHVNLADGPPPTRRGDLILCRQALQHLNAHEALRVLHHFSRSHATMLLTTTYELFPSRRFWRPDENYIPQSPGKEMLFLDLTKDPFELPPMLDRFVDVQRQEWLGFQEWLGLWRLPLVVGGLAAGTCTHGGAPHGGHGGGRLIRRQASMEHNHKRGPNTKGGRGRPSGVRPQSDIDT